MKYAAIILLCIGLMHNSAQASEESNGDPVWEELEQNRREARIVNDQTSDAEIMHVLQRTMKYMPDELQKIKDQPPKERAQTLDNFRRFFSAAGLPIREFKTMLDSSPEYEELMAHIWFEDTAVTEYAEKVLLSLSDIQYRTLLDTCVDLVTVRGRKDLRRRFDVLRDDAPAQLDFIQIDHVRIYDDYCEVYLYKGIGSLKSIGYMVKQDATGEWGLHHFNYLRSMDLTPIELPAE